MNREERLSLVGRAAIRTRRVGRFVLRYLLHFLRSNYVVAREILTPGSGVAPAVVDVAVRSRTPTELTVYMALVNLAPGTMTLAVSEDRRHVSVHGMHARDLDVFRAELRDLEEQLLAAWRPVAPRQQEHTTTTRESP